MSEDTEMTDAAPIHSPPAFSDTTQASRKRRLLVTPKGQAGAIDDDPTPSKGPKTKKKKGKKRSNPPGLGAGMDQFLRDSEAPPTLPKLGTHPPPVRSSDPADPFFDETLIDGRPMDQDDQEMEVERKLLYGSEVASTRAGRVSPRSSWGRGGTMTSTHYSDSDSEDPDDDLLVPGDEEWELESTLLRPIQGFPKRILLASQIAAAISSEGRKLLKRADPSRSAIITVAYDRLHANEKPAALAERRRPLIDLLPEGTVIMPLGDQVVGSDHPLAPAFGGPPLHHLVTLPTSQDLDTLTEEQAVVTPEGAFFTNHLPLEPAEFLGLLTAPSLAMNRPPPSPTTSSRPSGRPFEWTRELGNASTPTTTHSLSRSRMVGHRVPGASKGEVAMTKWSLLTGRVTDSVAGQRLWREVFRKIRIPCPLGDINAKPAPSVWCGVCHGHDHSTNVCLYPDMVGFPARPKKAPKSTSTSNKGGDRTRRR
ncbi:hypothetical protein DFP72DRAFT_1075525 [Ephemerocybe angulata]|uniref:Uncharacterized protein n=1 Tax=Ephemerocybe angulata TaxID=980116 RepID=A0A8H6HJD2_9AGAR|nr:hypothetical protein DFP72DRAFT_1075525 [Tulosesus angulatus]